MKASIDQQFSLRKIQNWTSRNYPIAWKAKWEVPVSSSFLLITYFCIASLFRQYSEPLAAYPAITVTIKVLTPVAITIYFFVLIRWVGSVIWCLPSGRIAVDMRPFISELTIVLVVAISVAAIFCFVSFDIGYETIRRTIKETFKEYTLSVIIVAIFFISYGISILLTFSVIWRNVGLKAAIFSYPIYWVISNLENLVGGIYTGIYSTVIKLIYDVDDYKQIPYYVIGVILAIVFACTIIKFTFFRKREQRSAILTYLIAPAVVWYTIFTSFTLALLGSIGCLLAHEYFHKRLQINFSDKASEEAVSNLILNNIVFLVVSTFLIGWFFLEISLIQIRKLLMLPEMESKRFAFQTIGPSFRSLQEWTSKNSPFLWRRKYEIPLTLLFSMIVLIFITPYIYFRSSMFGDSVQYYVDFIWRYCLKAVNFVLIVLAIRWIFDSGNTPGYKMRGDIGRKLPFLDVFVLLAMFAVLSWFASIAYPSVSIFRLSDFHEKIHSEIINYIEVFTNHSKASGVVWQALQLFGVLIGVVFISMWIKMGFHASIVSVLLYGATCLICWVTWQPSYIPLFVLPYLAGILGLRTYDYKVLGIGISRTTWATYLLWHTYLAGGIFLAGSIVAPIFDWITKTAGYDSGTISVPIVIGSYIVITQIVLWIISRELLKPEHV